MLNNLPDHLTADSVVLFVSPYHPDDIWESQMAGGSDDSMVKAFQNAAARDPEFVHYRRTVFGLAEDMGLNAWIIGDDLIIVEGDEAMLAEADKLLCENYDCHINPLADFMAHTFDPEFETHLDIPAQDRKLN